MQREAARRLRTWSARPRSAMICRWAARVSATASSTTDRERYMEAASIPGGERSILARSPLARLPDRALKYGLTALAGLILALIVYFFIRLVGEARPAFSRAGVFGFTFDNDWNVSA